MSPNRDSDIVDEHGSPADEHDDILDLGVPYRQVVGVRSRQFEAQILRVERPYTSTSDTGTMNRHTSPLPVGHDVTTPKQARLRYLLDG